jgi:hypothetical protein
MIAEGIQKIEKMVKDNFIIEIDGVKYGQHKYAPVVQEKKVSTLELSTLSGLYQYIMNNVDNLSQSRLMLIVKDYSRLDLVGKLLPICQERDTFVICHLDKNLKEFEFNTFMDHENFIIKLQSMFSDTPDKEILLRYVSNLSNSNSLELSDDGVSQSVVVKKGVSGALRENTIAPNYVELKPYRTFREIPQPSSKFLFRLKSNSNATTQCALFESDGGEWRNTATQFIKDYFMKSDMFGISVLA